MCCGGCVSVGGAEDGDADGAVRNGAGPEGFETGVEVGVHLGGEVGELSGDGGGVVGGGFLGGFVYGRCFTRCGGGGVPILALGESVGIRTMRFRCVVVWIFV